MEMEIHSLVTRREAQGLRCAVADKCSRFFLAQLERSIKGLALSSMTGCFTSMQIMTIEGFCSFGASRVADDHCSQWWELPSIAIGALFPSLPVQSALPAILDSSGL
jgi:hypothetical protein